MRDPRTSSPHRQPQNQGHRHARSRSPRGSPQIDSEEATWSQVYSNNEELTPRDEFTDVDLNEVMEPPLDPSEYRRLRRHVRRSVASSDCDSSSPDSLFFEDYDRVDLLDSPSWADIISNDEEASPVSPDVQIVDGFPSREELKHFVASL